MYPVLLQIGLTCGSNQWPNSNGVGVELQCYLSRSSLFYSRIVLYYRLDCQSSKQQQALGVFYYFPATPGESWLKVVAYLAEFLDRVLV